jgi:beta-carotene ketolase (CrtO type)
MVFFRPLSEVANYTTPIDDLFLNRARTNPERAISGMPRRNCAGVLLHQQHPLRERLADVGNSLKSTANSVSNIQ